MDSREVDAFQSGSCQGSVGEVQADEAYAPQVDPCTVPRAEVPVAFALATTACCFQAVFFLSCNAEEKNGNGSSDSEK
jgi:hypothetical protein